MRKVIEIGDWKLAHKQDVRYSINGECQHKELELDEKGDVVRCLKCGVQVSAFWALTMLSDRYNEEIAKLNRQKERLREEQQKSIHLLAARAVDDAWRSKTMIPTCPHCHCGITVNDGFGRSKVHKDIEARRREVAKQQKDGA